MNTFTKQLIHLTILWVAIILLTGCQSQTAVPSTAVPTQVMAEATPVPPQAKPTEKPTEPPTEPPALTQAPNAISANLLLDPALATDPDSLKISQYLYEGLVRLDASGKPEGALAQSWVVSDDQLDYIFTLRSGLTFSDHVKATAENPIGPDAVVENFNRWFDPDSPLRGKGDYATWKRFFLAFHGEKDADNHAKSPVDGIQKVDKDTVLIHLNRPMPELLTTLADPAFAILSPKALASGTYGDRQSTIVSSGAYVVKSWNDQGLTLSPNPNYWGKAATEDLTFTWR